MTTPRKRPRDFSQAAKLLVDIATGLQNDPLPDPETAACRLKRLPGPHQYDAAGHF
jgi:hypothetical protein